MQQSAQRSPKTPKCRKRKYDALPAKSPRLSACIHAGMMQYGDGAAASGKCKADISDTDDNESHASIAHLPSEKINK